MPQDKKKEWVDRQTALPNNLLLNSEVDIPPVWKQPKKYVTPQWRPPPQKAASQAAEEEQGGQLLDGFALVNACGVQLPEEVESVNVMGKRFVDVEVEDLHHFVLLQVLDVGDNLLPGMHSLAELPALRELKMQCNQLKGLYLQPGTFAALDILELSYNHLDASALSHLGALPNLRELDLSCNCISKVPKDAVKEDSFPRLETLHLGAQTPRLAANSIFRFAHLPGLRVLRIPANQMRRFDQNKMPQRAFQNLGLLDLSSNSLEVEDDIVVFTECPYLQKVILWGNPLARLAPRDIGAEVPFLGSPLGYLLLRKPEADPKPRLHTLYSDPVVLQDEGTHLPVTNAFQAEEMVSAFENVAVSGLAHLDGPQPPLTESQPGPAGAGGEDEEQHREDFFITGGGQDVPQDDMGYEEDEDDYPFPEELQVLGEEPARAAYLGGGVRAGGPSAALAALKFALKHPLVADSEGGGPPKHHLQTTTSVRAKQATKIESKEVSEKDSKKKLDPKAQQIMTIENILSSMKDRLAKVETQLMSTAQAQELPTSNAHE